MTIRTLLIAAVAGAAFTAAAQSPREQYEAFKNQARQEYNNFREQCNSRYADYLASAWQKVKQSPEIPKPKEEPPVPPKPYEEESKPTPPIDIKPSVVPPPPAPEPQPVPVSPVKEVPDKNVRPVNVDFYELSIGVRMPEAGIRLGACSPSEVANAWRALSADRRLDNTLRDCLEARIRYGMSDWTYLQFLDKLAHKITSGENEAIFLMAWLFCQSGYQMRLAADGRRLHMLYGSKHTVFDTPAYSLDGVYFYPYGSMPEQLSVANNIFEGETPMSFIISQEQKLGTSLTDVREVKSKKYPDVKIQSCVPKALLEFYSTYPSSKYGDNFMTQWAIYANNPMAEATRKAIYPDLLNILEGLSKKEKVERLLNLVQTGFRYDYDTNVWGCERAFFAEETLFYPFSDCEDRAILFSRLVRDLVGLDVALVHYPGHLATAVCFDEDAPGDYMILNGRKFVISDPTYIGAPIGAQMTNVDHSKAQAILLNR